jgi:hypothetical protein
MDVDSVESLHNYEEIDVIGYPITTCVTITTHRKN